VRRVVCLVFFVWLRWRLWPGCGRVWVSGCHSRSCAHLEACSLHSSPRCALNRSLRPLAHPIPQLLMLSDDEDLKAAAAIRFVPAPLLPPPPFLFPVASLPRWQHLDALASPLMVMAGPDVPLRLPLHALRPLHPLRTTAPAPLTVTQASAGQVWLCVKGGHYQRASVDCLCLDPLRWCSVVPLPLPSRASLPVLTSSQRTGQGPPRPRQVCQRPHVAAIPPYHPRGG
jgi:hypothetical protein